MEIDLLSVLIFIDVDIILIDISIDIYRCLSKPILSDLFQIYLWFTSNL